MSGRRLLVFNQYYAPDTASTGHYADGLCRGLAGRGWDVAVVTGQPSYRRDSPEAPAREVLGGVDVHRVPVGPKGRDTLVRRFGGYLHYQWGAWRRGRRLIRAVPPDAILTFHNSPFVGALGARFARDHGIPFLYSPYDFTPDAQRAGGWTAPGWLFGAFERVNDYIHAGADRIAVLSGAMADVLAEEKGVDRAKIEVVPLWARPELAPADREAGELDGVRRELGAGPDDLLLLYAGNMGLMQAVDPILDAAAALEDAPVRFAFMGQGVRRDRVEERVREEGLENVALLGFEPQERYEAIIRAADVALVTLRPGAERISFPSRALTSLSAGVPLLTVMPPRGGLARLVEATGCGWQVEDADGLEARVRALVADRGRLRATAERAAKVYRARFGREHTVDAYEELLEATMEAGGGPPAAGEGAR